MFCCHNDAFQQKMICRRQHVPFDAEPSFKVLCLFRAGRRRSLYRSLSLRTFLFPPGWGKTRSPYSTSLANTASNPSYMLSGGFFILDWEHIIHKTPGISLNFASLRPCTRKGEVGKIWIYRAICIYKKSRLGAQIQFDGPKFSYRHTWVWVCARASVQRS